jgi:hypothetical protein
MNEPLERDVIAEYARTSPDKRYERLREAIRVRCKVDIDEWEVLRSLFIADGVALQALAQFALLIEDASVGRHS